MRLLTYDSDEKLYVTRDLADYKVSPYAILSHTWGEDDEEVTFHEIGLPTCKQKLGYKKIEFCGKQVRQDGWQHFWVDTCCIDKTNHVELSKAITSMYRWYQQAQVCYVYLADVSCESTPTGHDWQSSFRQSRWLARGWTLQELLAPQNLVFYSKEWCRLGTKDDLKGLLNEITGIPKAALENQPLSQFPIVERMQWTRGRRTKEKEDQAYCLLGIFGVYMYLNYGEGDNAFRRLQKKIDAQYGGAGSSATRSQIAMDRNQMVITRIATLTETCHQTTEQFTCGISHATGNNTSMILRPKNVSVSADLFPATNESMIKLVSRQDLADIQLSKHHASPHGLLEQLPSFRPSGYTIHDGVAKLFAYAIEATSTNTLTRSIMYAMLYARTDGRWIRLSTLLTITIDSMYWCLTATRHQKTKTTGAIPPALISHIENTLNSSDQLEQDAQLSIIIDRQVGLEKVTADVHERRRPPLTIAVSYDSCFRKLQQALTDNFLHTGCPMYNERELHHRPLRLFRQSNLFVAFLESRWVLEYRFGTHRLQLDNDLYTLRALQCLQQRTVGINPLIGVVIDDESGLINGYLRDMPSRGRLFNVMRQALKSNQLTWQRCERWCRTIVKGVAATHSKLFTIGLLNDLPDCGIAVDKDDEAVFYRAFSPKFLPAKNDLWPVPPEYHHLADHENPFLITPEFDIYQLGLLLWRMARLTSGTKCMNLLFNSNSEYICCDPIRCRVCPYQKSERRLPIQLPPCSDQTPEYMQKIIAACRSEQPRSRPPAWKILELFPTTNDHQVLPGDSQKSVTPESSEELQTYQNMYGDIVMCSLCGNLTTDHHFHCHVCHAADFDMCPQCFQSGLHCDDEQHLLWELKLGNSRTNGLKAYSNVKCTGIRDIFVL